MQQDLPLHVADGHASHHHQTANHKPLGPSLDRDALCILGLRLLENHLHQVRDVHVGQLLRCFMFVADSSSNSPAVNVDVTIGQDNNMDDDVNEEKEEATRNEQLPTTRIWNVVDCGAVSMLRRRGLKAGASSESFSGKFRRWHGSRSCFFRSSEIPVCHVQYLETRVRRIGSSK